MLKERFERGSASRAVTIHGERGLCHVNSLEDEEKRKRFSVVDARQIRKPAPLHGTRVCFSLSVRVCLPSVRPVSSQQ